MNIKARGQARIAVKQRLGQGAASLEELIREAERVVPYAAAIREYNDHLERTRLYHERLGKPVKNPTVKSVSYERYHGMKQLVMRVLWSKEFVKRDDGRWELRPKEEQ